MAVVFDVNETLLDLGALDPLFAATFGDTDARREWFGQVLQSALVVTVLDSYVDFGRVAAAVLDATAARRRVELAESSRNEILANVRRLPPHPDVVPGLELLTAAGFRLVALTNSPPPVVEAQMDAAGLTPFFERLLTVDPVRRFKPAREVYDAAAAELEEEPAGLRLVAAHDWDVAGALAAGWRAAFVARPGTSFSPLLARPDLTGPDLVTVAERIIASGG